MSQWKNITLEVTGDELTSVLECPITGMFRVTRCTIWQNCNNNHFE